MTSSSGTTQCEQITIQVKKINHESSSFPYSGREGQVACCVGQKVYIFGGVEQGQGNEPKETNEMIVFDMNTLKWSQPDVTGMIPPPRSASSLVAVGTKLYLFGGLSHMSGWFDDIFVYDTVTNSWCILETEGNRPRARDKLQAVVIDTNIYYFGGFGPKSDEAEAADLEGNDDDEEDEEDIPESHEQEGAEFGWFNDLYVLDTVNLKWSQPMHMNLGVPTQRAAHAMCTIGRHLIIFGGRDIEERQNDMHIFNVDTRKWLTDLSVTGQVPAPRSFHSLTAVGNKAVLFGGRGRNDQHFDKFDVFDFGKKEWLPTTIEGDKPASRGQHCAVAVGDSIFLFGGSGNFSPETMQCQTFYTDAFVVKSDKFSSNAQSNGLPTESNDS
ncbi:kelch domain-containing protein 1 [Biomphalaria glabrata]|uniref:Kelch domain-containing protein 2-like n=1 Tax=Biomphalaria glabrata TaxID=6526 RepID=A0A9W3AF21_BIOGL|nr:kelch domain-containing protein 2-like [Biomphalaria glabrata]KAI8755247.1 acyl-CoA-binding domain-containing protein 4-like; partial [Biomphalaria glabrata]